MSRRFSTRTAIAVVFLATFSVSALAAQTAYRSPPAPIPGILEQPALPLASTSPDGRLLLLQDRAAMPPIAELAAPMLRLAGMRINPATNGPAASAVTLTGYRFLSLTDGAEAVVGAHAATLGVVAVRRVDHLHRHPR
jgi:hypothetical protein